MDNAVWFVANHQQGPWEVATEVPEEIYTIPPSSPVYYATFVRIYQAGEDEVEVGYTPGYQGTTRMMARSSMARARIISPGRRPVLRLGLDLGLRLCLRPLVSMVGVAPLVEPAGGIAGCGDRERLRSLGGPQRRRSL